MAKIPQPTLTQRIDLVDVHGEFRPYLGGSYIGNSCMRSVFYTFRWYSPKVVQARMERLFRLGDFIEEQIIQALETVGITVTDSQQRVGGFWGHGGGHTDGTADLSEFSEEFKDELFLFEAKSMSASNYKKCQKVGVKEFKSDYWYQIHKYMGELGLKKCLWMYYNKDNSDLSFYIVDFDPEAFEEITQREMSIIVAGGPDDFRRIGGSSWWECKFCDHRAVCHHGQDPVRTCRSCKHITLEPEGKWDCMKFDAELTTEEQLKACDHYQQPEENK